jgi:hypothetical protein
VAGRECDHELVVAPGLDAQAPDRGGRPYDGEVDLVLEQGLLAPGRIHLGDVQVDAGAGVPEGGQGAQQGLAERGGHHADTQGSGQAGPGLDGDLLCVPGCRDERAALGRERPAGLGERDLAPAAVEQRHAQLAFQLEDRLAQRRLRHGELFRGAAEVEGFGDGQEVAGLANLDHQSLRISVIEEIRPSVYGSGVFD